MSNRQHIQLAERVLWLRHAQLAINEALHGKEFQIPVHLALGHEAIAVGVTDIMSEADRLLLSHRNMHFNLTRLERIAPVIAEFRGEGSGLATGSLGSMNLSQPNRGLPYTSSILGNNLAVASGVAAALRGKGAAFVVTGDGAMEEGSFYESLLMAGAAAAPLVIIVENNGWSMYTQIDDRRPSIDLGAYAISLGAKYFSGDGVDVVSVNETIRQARESALARGGPCVVELSVSTLGDVTDGDRLINYHHGPAPEVHWQEWPVLGNTNTDPVAFLGEYFDIEELKALSVSAYHSVKGERE